MCTGPQMTNTMTFKYAMLCVLDNRTHFEVSAFRRCDHLGWGLAEGLEGVNVRLRPAAAVAYLLAFEVFQFQQLTRAPGLLTHTLQTPAKKKKIKNKGKPSILSVQWTLEKWLLQDSRMGSMGDRARWLTALITGCVAIHTTSGFLVPKATS